MSGAVVAAGEQVGAAPAAGHMAEKNEQAAGGAGSEAAGNTGAAVWQFFDHETDYPDLCEQDLCERLGRALSFATVSHMDDAQTDWGAFDALQTWMRAAYPHVFSAGEAEVIGHSLLVTIPGSDASLRPMMLMGHQDVVSVVPGTEGDWGHGAFSGDVDDTYVWGRGAIDMKDQVTGILEAVEYALAHGWRLRRTIVLAFGQDEETNQFGAHALGQELERRGVELEFLVDEGDYRIVSSAEYGAPGFHLMHADLAEKGYADVVLRAKSAGGHSSNPFGGTSLGVLSQAIARICAIEWPVRLTPLTAALLRELAPAMTSGPLSELGIACAADVDERADEVARACLADPQLFPLVTTTCAPTMIEGGSASCNVMPQDMWANVNFRMLEGTTRADVLERCREAVAGLGVTVELGPGSSEATHAPEPGGAGLAYVRAAAGRYFREPDENSGRTPVRVVPSTVIGATDAANYEHICPACIRFSAFVVDDDECARGVHGTDERITRRAYLQGIRFLLRLIDLACVQVDL